MSDWPVRGAILLGGFLLGLLLGRYTDAPWVTGVVLAATVVLLVRRMRRR